MLVHRVSTKCAEDAPLLAPGVVQLIVSSPSASIDGHESKKPMTPGLVIDAQAWFRDPGAARNTNLSDALEFTLAP